MKRVLLIAFHFPPRALSSGVHRTLALVRGLSAHGWEPIVLTAGESAHQLGAVSVPASLPPSVVVRRTLALDAARHFAVFGRYPISLALPDRWASWQLTAVPAGIRLIKKFKPSVVYSTYPIATAHRIASHLQARTKVPWVADFRDPMIEHIDGCWYPANERIRQSRFIVEKKVAEAAVAASFCTESARSIFVDRFRESGISCKTEVIANGYDSEGFAAAEKLAPAKRDGVLHLVHSGTLYPGPDRDPSGMLRALASLRSSGTLPADLRVTLRATGFDSIYRPIVHSLHLEDIVALAPPLDYVAALREMLDADGLLLFQGRTSDPAIPAKAYEYLRAMKPILALGSFTGETARLLNDTGVGMIAPIEDPQEISQALNRFLERIRSQEHCVLTLADADRFSRTKQVQKFAELFDSSFH